MSLSNVGVTGDFGLTQILGACRPHTLLICLWVWDTLKPPLLSLLPVLLWVIPPRTLLPSQPGLCGDHDLALSWSSAGCLPDF